MLNNEKSYYDKENDVYCEQPEFKYELESTTPSKTSLGKKILCVALVVAMCLMSVGYLF